MFFTDLAQLTVFNYSKNDKIGEFSPARLFGQDSNMEAITAVHRAQNHENLLMFGDLTSPELKVLGLSGGMIVRQFSPSSEAGRQSSVLRCVTEGNTLITSNENFHLSVFDLRVKDSVIDLTNFEGSTSLPISLDLENNKILLGTQEGPLLFDIRASAQDSLVLTDTSSPFTKAQFIGDGCFLNADIHEDKAYIVDPRLSEGEDPQNGTFDLQILKGSEIVDISTNKLNNEVLVASKTVSGFQDQGKPSSMVQLFEKGQSGDYKMRDFINLDYPIRRASFDGSGNICVVGDHEVSVYATEHQQFIKKLINRVSRRASSTC